MNVIIMAQGQARRFPGKHFAKVNGQPIIARLVRMIRELSPESKITIVADNTGEFQALGCPIYTQEDPGDGLMTGLFNTQELWKDGAVIILGDVVFSRQALAKVLTTTRLTFSGRSGKNRYTMCPYREIFALTISDIGVDRVRLALSTPALRMVSDGRLWGLKQNMGERSSWLEIDDWTDDVDTPEDLAAVQRVLDGLLVTVTTCKGRLDHLRLTLPELKQQLGPLPEPRYRRRLHQPEDHVLPTQHVVVDYDCPDKSGQWAIENVGSYATLIDNEPHFHKTKALNIGARAAIAMDARWLCFVDADTMVSAGFKREVVDVMGRGVQAVAFGPPNSPELVGFLLVSVDLFLRVGGFDEGFEGWGFEDVDMRLRLLVDGGAEPSFVTTLSSVYHPQELREKFSRLPYRVALEKNRAIFHRHLEERSGSRPPGFSEYVERWIGKDLGS